jgi:hypothetical protein
MLSKISPDNIQHFGFDLKERLAHSHSNIKYDIINVGKILPQQLYYHSITTSVASSSSSTDITTTFANLTKSLMGFFESPYSTSYGLIVPIYPDRRFLCFICGEIIQEIDEKLIFASTHIKKCFQSFQQKVDLNLCPFCPIESSDFKTQPHHIFTDEHILNVNRQYHNNVYTESQPPNDSSFYSPYFSIIYQLFERYLRHFNIYALLQESNQYNSRIVFFKNKLLQLATILRDNHNYHPCDCCENFSINTLGINITLLLNKYVNITLTICPKGKQSSYSANHLVADAICASFVFRPIFLVKTKTNADSTANYTKSDAEQTSSHYLANLWSTHYNNLVGLYQIFLDEDQIHLQIQIYRSLRSKFVEPHVSRFLYFYLFREKIALYDSALLPIHSYQQLLKTTGLADTIVVSGHYLTNHINFANHFRHKSAACVMEAYVLFHRIHYSRTKRNSSRRATTDPLTTTSSEASDLDSKEERSSSKTSGSSTTEQQLQQLFKSFGLAPTKDLTLVTKAWRKKMSQYHPDKLQQSILSKHPAMTNEQYQLKYADIIKKHAKISQLLNQAYTKLRAHLSN